MRNGEDVLGTVIYEHNNSDQQTLLLKDLKSNESQEHHLENADRINHKGRQQLVKAENTGKLTEEKLVDSLTVENNYRDKNTI